jgi:DNA-binding MarR family transcriptional regulator
MPGPATPGFNDLLVGLFRATTTMARGTAQGHGVSLHQAIALDVVGRGSPHPMAELARELDLTMGAVSKLVDRLVALGLLERVPRPGDRRVVGLALTSAGLAVHEAIRADWERLMGAWLATVPERHGIEAALAALLDAAPSA